MTTTNTNKEDQELHVLLNSELGDQVSNLLWELWQNGRWFQQPVRDQLASSENPQRYGRDQQDILTEVLQLVMRRELEARIDELDKLMSSKVLERAWVPELDIYYNNRIDQLRSQTQPNEESTINKENRSE